MKEGKEIIEEILNREVCVFYQSGDRVFRVIGKCIQIGADFIKVDDNKLGICIVSIPRITKIDFLHKISEAKDNEGV